MRTEDLHNVEENLDRILLDVVKSSPDFPELCRCLEEHESSRDIPVTFLTITGDPRSKLHSFGLGAVHTISIPLGGPEQSNRVSPHHIPQR